MHALLAALGQPQRELRVAHITGTKGKGSTATMLSSILQAARYRVGTYTRHGPLSITPRAKAHDLMMPSLPQPTS